MQMANLPDSTDKVPVPEPDERLLDAIAVQVFEGKRPADIAKQVHPKDEAKRKRLRNRIRYLAYNEPRLAAKVAAHAQAELMFGLGPTVRALLRQAQRRPDAAKLVLETSGFHNPRVQHDHSGEIKVSLNIPRPQREALPEAVPDAEVVEED